MAKMKKPKAEHGGDANTKKSDSANKIPVEKFGGKKIGGEKTAHAGKNDKAMAPFGGSGKKKGTKKPKK